MEISGFFRHTCGKIHQLAGVSWLSMCSCDENLADFLKKEMKVSYF